MIMFRDELDLFKSGVRFAAQGKLCASTHHFVTSFEHENTFFRASHIPMHIAHATEWGSFFTRGPISHVLEGVSQRAHFAGFGFCSIGMMANVYKGLYDTASRFVHRSPLAPPRLYEVPKYDHWKAKEAVEAELRKNWGTFYDAYIRARSRIGYPGNFDYSAFKSLVQSTGLVSSYNSIHPNDKIAVAKGYRGEIGGVATKVATIKGLKDSPDQVLFDNAIFCVETADGRLPFSNAEFKQIVRELAQGIYLHNTYPFFSLHFNDNGCLYPVIHPAYQNTLVGKVIGLLDYYMKCYLNGGYFEEEFLNSWHLTQNTDRDYLKKHRKDLKKYCREAKLDYTSLREYACKAGLEEVPEEKNQFSVRNSKFRTSFRIIAEQKEIKKQDNIFIINPDFNVEYTVDLAPDYKEYLEKYVKEQGQHPADYQKLLLLYSKMADDIKENMPKIPFCRDYFQMLGVISFLCYYLTTLKEKDRVPVIPASELADNFHFPKALPPIPVRHYKFHPIKINIKELFEKLVLKNKVQLNQWLLATFENPSLDLYFELQSIFETTLKTLIAVRMPAKADAESDEYIHQHEIMLVKELVNYIKKQLAEIRSGIKKNIIELLDVAKTSFDLDLKLDDKRKTIDQINIIKAGIETRIEKVKSNYLSEFPNKLRSILEEQDKDANETIQMVNQKIDSEMEETVQLITQQIDKNKSSELAKVPVASRGRPEVTAFIRQLDNAKTSKINEIKLKVETLRAEKKAEIIDQLDSIKSKITAELETHKSEHLAKIEHIKTNFIASLNEMMKTLQNFASEVFINETNTSTLAFKHPCSLLDIGDNGFYEENGDNVRIVGGCSVTLPNLQPVIIPIDSPLRSTLLPTLHRSKEESLFEVEHGVRKYAIFKLKTQHKPAYSFLDYPELAGTLTHTAAKTKSETLGPDEFKFLSESIDTEAKETKCKFNSRGKDNAGHTLVHYAVSLTNQTTMLDIITAEDKTLLLEVDKFGNLPIHTAATNGNTEAIMYIAARVPQSLDAKNQQGLTPLLLAAQAGHRETVEKLLNLGADVNYRLPNGLFALYLALQNNFSEVALLLIPKANVNFHLDSGSTSLHLATDAELDAVSLALIKAGADVNYKRRVDDYTPFHNAVEKGSVEICMAMLATGKVAINASLPTGEAALHLAAKNGQLDVVKLLLEAKYPADINQKDTNGETALMAAIRAGHSAVAMYLGERTKINIKNKQEQSASLLALMLHQVEVADVLFQRGEDPSLRDKNELSAVYYLLKNGEYHRYKQLQHQYKIHPNLIFCCQSSVAIVAKQGHHLFTDYLLESKADFQNNENGWELIHYAAKTNHIRFLKKWFKSNPDSNGIINSGPDKNKTLIYIAAENGSEECFNTLIKLAKSDLIIKAFNDRHLLYAAVASGNEKIIETALAHCEDANIAIDDDHNTAIHIAAQFGLIQTVEFLVSCGADPTKANNNRITPFHLAIINDDEEMLKKLLKLTPTEKVPTDLYELAFEHKKTACLKLLNSASDAEKNRALIKSCRNGDLRNVQTLLNVGIKPQEDKREGHALLHAIENNDIAIVHSLLTAINDPEILIKGFELALKRHQLDIIRFFIERRLLTKLQLNKYYSLNVFTTLALINSFVKYDQAKEALIKALEQSDHVSFSKIIQEGFPINYAHFDFKGKKQPLLHCAFNLKAGWALEILLKYGADPKAKDYDGLNIMHKLNMFNTEELDQELQLIDLHFKGFKKELLEAKSVRNTPIDRALKFNRVSHFKSLIKETSSIYTNQGNTLLHAAVMSNDFSFVESLLKEGFDVNVINSQKLTPLMLAVMKGNMKLVQLLLSCGADPNKVDCRQNNCLHLAIAGSHPEIAMLLIPFMTNLDQPNRNGNTPFLLSAGEGLQSLIEIFITRQVDIHTVNREGQNAMHLAAQNGHDKIIDRLGALGLEIDLLETSKDKICYSPLHWAAHRGHLAAFIALVKLGADPLKKDTSGHNALEYAIASKKDEIIAYVMQLPMIDMTDAFFIAVQIEYMPLLTRLLLSGFNVDVLRDDGSTALHLAASSGASRSVALLLEQGIKLELSNEGESPLHTAARNGSVSIIQQLVDAKCDLDIQNKEGLSALHIACQNKNGGAVLQLLKAGADPKLLNKEGLTASQVSLLNNDWETAKLLMIMGDDFYLENFMASLPEHLNKKFQRFEVELAQMKEIAEQSTSQFVCAIKSHSHISLRLLCQKNPDYLENLILIDEAVICNNLDAVKILIEHKPDCIKQTFQFPNYNALTLALKFEYTKIADYLVAAGATIFQEIDGKSQIQIAINAIDAESFFGLLKFGAQLSLKNMQFVLSNQELSKAYFKFISNDSEVYKKLQNPSLSSETIGLFIKWLNDALSKLNPKEDQYIVESARLISQQLIAQNESLLASAKPMLHSKQIALNANLKTLKGMSSKLTTEALFMFTKKDTDEVPSSDPNKFEILFVLHKWQDAINKRTSFETKFDMNNHLSFFNIPKRQIGVEINREARCVIL